MALIELITEINAPVERCFDLARSIDLHKLSTGDTEEEAIAGKISGLIGMGETVTWRAKHFGIRQTLTSKITAFKYSIHFRDEMLKGPFRKICHDHFFESQKNLTIMRDHFEFESPLGILGKFINEVFLKAYMKKLLSNRNSFIKSIAEGKKWKEILPIGK